MPRLIVKLPGGPKTVPVGEEAVTIGRTAENTLPLDLEGVSRRHAQILFVGKGYEVVDMGSRNGTKVNGKKVPRAMLKSGDVVHIGGVDMVFEDGAPAPAGGDSGGLEIEELDLGGAQAAAPSAASASATMSMPAGGGPAGECVIRIIDGERKGTEVALKGARTTFGRRATNTVSFQDAGVSGVHCEITREANGYVLRDLGSTNGTIVDGEPVVELLLRHNSRIRIGAQRILFVDPTVADIESSLAAADDGSEWGLMKGEIDVTASRVRGGRGLLVAVVVLAAAGGGAWWVLRNRPVHAEVPAVKDNRVSDFSFEDGIVHWTSTEEEGPTARILGTPEAPRAASGVHSLEVPSRGEGLGRVEYSNASEGLADTSVAVDTPYEVSARVGSGKGAVVVVWISSGHPDLVREVCTPVVEGGAAWPETKATVTAPAHATAAKIQLAAFGGGPAVFDDVVFRRAEGGGAQDLVSGELRVRIDSAGFLEAVRGGEVLLTQGGVAPSVDASVESLLGAKLDAPPASTGTTVSASGTSPGGEAFEVKAEAVGGGATLTAAPKGGAGAFTFTCPGGMALNAMTLVMEKSATVVPEVETFRQEGVQKIIVGAADGPPPFVLSADPASAGFTFTSRRTSRGLRIQLVPAAGASPAVRLSVDLGLETQAAQELVRKARDRESADRPGEAAEAYERVAVEFHYLPDFRKQGTEAAGKIRAEGQRALAEAREAARNGRQFGSVPDLQRALSVISDRLLPRFEGHRFGVEAEELRAQVEEDLKNVGAAANADREDRLYSQAADHGQNGRPALQLPLLEEILRIAPPDDDIRRRVAGEVDEVRRRVEEERSRLYGTKKK